VLHAFRGRRLSAAIFALHAVVFVALTAWSWRKWLDPVIDSGRELYVPWAETDRLWSALLDSGKPMEVAPIGLGARDTLRLEMRYALYGNDIDATTNPLEAILGWVVKPAKGDFLGKASIERVRADGPRRKLVGLERMPDKPNPKASQKKPAKPAAKSK